MCKVASRCKDRACHGACVKPKAVWKQLLSLCPNMKRANGNKIVKSNV